MVDATLSYGSFHLSYRDESKVCEFDICIQDTCINVHAKKVQNLILSL